MIKYVTVAKETSAEQIIEKSRFIAYIKPINSREDADAFLANIKSKHKDATHNVPAFVIGEKQELQWASDDGEPSGTSGAPILQMIVKEGLSNVAVVVTRYFGGIKLGTGGLVRAYTGVARAAIEEAGRFEVRDYRENSFYAPYNLLKLLQKKSDEIGYEIKDIKYEEQLLISIKYEPENEEIIIKCLDEILSGKLIFLA